MIDLVAFPSAEWRAALRARGRDPRFAAARRALDDRLAGYHRALPELPVRQAGYYHDYFCPMHAVQLVFDPREPHRHPCPVDGEVFSGEPFDSAWGWSVNDMLSDAALRAAVRHAMGAPDALDDSDDDAAVVRHVLAGYAERYRTLPRSPNPYPGAYHGIACFSALDEDVWIIRLAWAAALLGDALAPDDRRAIREGLFEPAREHLARVRYRAVQNVANWDNSALLTLAMLLGDDVAIDEILEGEYGVRDELYRGVGGDGLWWEVSLSYHYYVLAALSWTVRGLRASGRPFAQEGVVREMFRAPLDLAFPDGSLPAVNDCWYHIGLLGEVGHGIPGSEGFHELAWAWFGEPDFGQVLAANAARTGRVTLEALLDGAEAPAAAPTGRAIARRPSRQLDDLAVLRTDELTAIVKASLRDGDAHGHPDQLGLQVFGAGGRIAIDSGTPGYGIALNDTWYRQTAAHSTVLLDSASQPPASAAFTSFDDGSVAAEARWADAGGWAQVAARTRTIDWPQSPSMAYADVRMQRRMRLDGGSVSDSFEVEAPGKRTIDWLLHIRGTYAGPTEAAPGVVAGACGYDQLTEVRRILPPGPLEFLLPNGWLVLDLTPEPDEDWFLASAPGNPVADRQLLLIRRRRAAQTRFVTRITVHCTRGASGV